MGRQAWRDLDTLTSESTTAWRGFVERLVARGLARPPRCVSDGSLGLRAAVETSWPGMAVHRCAGRTVRNLERHAPAQAREELAADDPCRVEAESGLLARQASPAGVVMGEAPADGRDQSA